MERKSVCGEAFWHKDSVRPSNVERYKGNRERGCQIAIAKILDGRRLALWAGRTIAP